MSLCVSVCVGIHPDTFSSGMFSWFPIYVPLMVCVVVSVYTVSLISSHYMCVCVCAIPNAFCVM